MRQLDKKTHALHDDCLLVDFRMSRDELTLHFIHYTKSPMRYVFKGVTEVFSDLSAEPRPEIISAHWEDPGEGLANYSRLTVANTDDKPILAIVFKEAFELPVETVDPPDFSYFPRPVYCGPKVMMITVIMSIIMGWIVYWLIR